MNNSLVYPFFPYFSSKMTSLGLWWSTFFSLTQSSTIWWTTTSCLPHLTATLLPKILHILRPNTLDVLPVLLSFTSTRLRDLLWQSPHNPPNLPELPSIFPTTVIYFTNIGPTTFPSSRALQIYHLIVIQLLSKSLFLCTNLFTQSMNKSELLLLSSF